MAARLKWMVRGGSLNGSDGGLWAARPTTMVSPGGW